MSQERILKTEFRFLKEEDIVNKRFLKTIRTQWINETAVIFHNVYWMGYINQYHLNESIKIVIKVIFYSFF